MLASNSDLHHALPFLFFSPSYITIASSSRLPVHSNDLPQAPVHEIFPTVCVFPTTRSSEYLRKNNQNFYSDDSEEAHLKYSPPLGPYLNHCESNSDSTKCHCSTNGVLSRESATFKDHWGAWSYRGNRSWVMNLDLAVSTAYPNPRHRSRRDSPRARSCFTYPRRNRRRRCWAWRRCRNLYRIVRLFY